MSPGLDTTGMHLDEDIRRQEQKGDHMVSCQLDGRNIWQ